MATNSVQTHPHYVRPRKLDNKVKFKFDPDEIVITAKNPSVTNAQRRLSNRHREQEEVEGGRLERPPTRRGGSVPASFRRNCPTTPSDNARKSRDTNNMRFELIPGVKVKHAHHMFNKDSTSSVSHNTGVRDAYTTGGSAFNQGYNNFQSNNNNNIVPGVRSITKRESGAQVGSGRALSGAAQMRMGGSGHVRSPVEAPQLRMGRGAQARLSRQCNYSDSDEVVMYDEVSPSPAVGHHYGKVTAAGGNRKYFDQVTQENFTDLRQKLNKINNIQPPRHLEMPSVKHERSETGVRSSVQVVQDTLDSDLERFQALNIKSDESINNNNKRFQPFLEKKNCICLRPLMFVTCKECSKTIFGRIMKCCPLHPEEIYLMDVKNCGDCRSMSLAEYIIPEHIDVSHFKKNTVMRKK